MSDYPAGTILGAWPVTIGGLELDRVDVHSVEWNLTALTGWGSSAPSGEVVDRPGANGASAGDWTLKPKEYGLAGSVDAETPQAREAAEQRLRSAITRRDTDMIVHDGIPWRTTVRVNGPVEITRTSVYTFDFDATVIALDPLRYSLAARGGSTGFPTSTGGKVWPLTRPATSDAVITTGELTLPNLGNEIAWPLYRIDGPVINPSIVNATTGQVMRFELELLTGQWLTVDADNRHVLADGDPGASRRTTHRGDWFGLAPEQTTTIRFDGDSAGPGAQLAATYYDTGN